MRSQIRALIAGIPPLDDEERFTIAWVLQWIDGGYDLWRTAKPATPPVHLVSYFPVVSEGSVLLVAHRNAGRWLPHGGHVEPGEHPRDTVHREAAEELSRPVELLQSTPLLITKTTTVGQDAGHTDVSLWFPVAGRPPERPFDPDEHKDAQWFAADALPSPVDPHLARFLAKLAR